LVRCPSSGIRRNDVGRGGLLLELAAASLQQIGLASATDMIGGFEAWRDAGLPVEPCSD